MSTKPFVIGLVGGIASGKSHVARKLQTLGAYLIDAGQIGHQVLLKPLVARRLRQLFGEKIVAATGAIDRQQLAEVVFVPTPEGREAKAKLEEVVHPLIHSEAVHQLRKLCELDSPPPAVIIDAPLLLEASWAPMCDAILFVDTPQELRNQRALQRGWPAEEHARREASQLNLAEKRAAATHIIRGDLAEAELDSFCESLWLEIVSR